MIPSRNAPVSGLFNHVPIQLNLNQIVSDGAESPRAIRHAIRIFHCRAFLRREQNWLSRFESAARIKAATACAWVRAIRESGAAERWEFAVAAGQA